MKRHTGNPDCKPIIECEVSDPYSNPSVLAQSQCYHVSATLHFIMQNVELIFFNFMNLDINLQLEGDIDVTYWSYLLIRSIADIFPVSIIVLLNTAVIIATRETSTGRSEIGRQLAWGALAWGKY